MNRVSDSKDKIVVANYKYLFSLVLLFLIYSVASVEAKFIDLECVNGDCNLEAKIDDKDLNLDFEKDTEIVQLRLSKNLTGEHINADSEIKVTLFNGPIEGGNVLSSSTIDLSSIKRKNKNIPLDFIVARFSGLKEFYIELTNIDRVLIVAYRIEITGTEESDDEPLSDTEIDPAEIGIIDNKDCNNFKRTWDKIQCNNDELILERLSFELDQEIQNNESFIVKDEQENYIIKIPAAGMIAATLEAQRVIDEEKEATEAAEAESGETIGHISWFNGLVYYEDGNHKIALKSRDDVSSFVRGVYEGRLLNLERLVTQLYNQSQASNNDSNNDSNNNGDEPAPSVPPEEPPAAPVITFPLDDIDPKPRAVFSINKLHKDFNGILFKVQRESDNTIFDGVYNSKGKLNTGAIRKFCRDTNCYLSTWFDQMNSGNPAYQTSLAKQPYFNASAKPYGVKFDTGRFLNIDDSAVYNTVTSTNKDMSISFVTGTEVLTRQVIFEEGGTTNGLNIYIEDGRLIWSIWSESTGWGYTHISSAIGPNQDHTARLVYNGTEEYFEAYMDGHLIKRVQAGTSLSKHTGNNALGGQAEHSYFISGKDQQMEAFQFKGVITDFIYY